MRKPTLVQKLKQSIKRLESTNRSLYHSHAEKSLKLDMAEAQLQWMTEQRTRDRLMIEHLIETAKYAAMKGVQAGVVMPTRR